MIGWAVGAIVGAVLMGRSKPQTLVIKREVLGTRSGMVYPVEELPEAAMLVAHPQGAKLVFMRKKNFRWAFIRGQGDPAVIKAVRADVQDPDGEA